MSLETTLLFSKTSLPQIAKIIGANLEKDILIKDYHGGLRATIVEDSDTEETILRFSRKVAGDEERNVIMEIPLDHMGVNINSRGEVIFAKAALKGELVSFSKLTKDGMPVIDGLQKSTGGARKAARFALDQQWKMLNPAVVR